MPEISEQKDKGCKKIEIVCKKEKNIVQIKRNGLQVKSSRMCNKPMHLEIKFSRL